MKKLLFAALFAGLTLAAVPDAPANNGGGQFSFQGGSGPRLPFFRRTPVPAFQAAPWYLYWPYNAHFQTPAPLNGAFYAPPGAGFGGGLQNPYFPSPYGGYAVPQVMPAAPQALPGSAAPQPQPTPGTTVTPGTAMPAAGLPVR